MSTKKKLQLNSKRALCSILLALLIVFGAFFVTDISARFIASDSADKGATVAKWAVVLKNGDEPLSQSFEMALTAKPNPNVAPGKFAPSSELQSTFILDLTDTDVAVDYNITADTRVFGNKLQAGDIEFAVYDNDSPIVPGKEIFVSLSADRVRTLKFVLSWNTDGDSASDVDFALNNQALALPVSIRVRQHIDGDDAEDDRKISSAISYAETTESKPRDTKPLSYVFDEQDVLSDNPESGFYSISLMKLTESGTDSARSGGVVVKSGASSMLHMKVDLSAFSGGMNGSNDIELSVAAISAFADVLESIKQNDNTVILRFVYDNFGTGTDGVSKVEPAQSMLLRHIGQLSDTFKAYATTINAIQIGFYGLWGECYYNTDAVKNGAKYYPETVNALLNATSGTEITIAVRAVQYYNWYKDGGVHADDARVGIFNDAYGANATDMGTYSDRTTDTNWLSSRSAHTYYGGEAITDDDAENGVGIYNAPDYFIDEAYKLHTSYLNWEWNQALHAQWATIEYTGEDKAYNDTALAYIESHLGYRFVVEDVKTYNTVAVGEKLPIDIAIRNTGFANMIKSKRCDIVIVNSSGVVAAELTDVDIDARKFESRSTVTKSISVMLPTTLAGGNYGVYLRMSSGQTLNNGRYYSAVRFANEDMWNDGLQANYIAEIEVTA